MNHPANLYFDEQDKREITANPLPGEEGLKQRAAVLNGQLEWLAEETDDPLRAYLIFDSAFATSHAPFLTQLRRHLPALPQLELVGGDLASERQLCRLLRDLLYRANRARENRA